MKEFGNETFIKTLGQSWTNQDSRSTIDVTSQITSFNAERVMMATSSGRKLLIRGQLGRVWLALEALDSLIERKVG